MTMQWTSVLSQLKALARRRSARVAVALVGVYALIGFLLLPYLAERYVPKYARETLQRQAEVADIRFNPFLFKVEADGFRLREADGRPIVAARHLLVDFNLSSLFRWAWTFGAIRADGLALNVVTEADGRLNLAVLADSFPKSEQPEPEDQDPARMLLSRITITASAVTYSDRRSKDSASTTLAPVNIDLENVTTLPERDGHYAFNAEFPGSGSVYLQGTTQLKPFAASGDISIQGFRPAAVWPFLEERLRLAEPQGELVLQAGYRFASQPDGPQFELNNITAYIAGLDLREPDAEMPLLALEAVELKGGAFDLAKRSLTLPEIGLRTGRASARIAKNGVVNWQALNRTPAVENPAAEHPSGDQRAAVAKDVAQRPWRIRFSAVKLNDVAVQVVDASRTVPWKLEVARLGAQLTVNLDAGGPETRFDAKLGDLDAQTLALTPLDGAPAFSTLDRVRLTNGRVDGAARALGAERITLTGGKTRIERDARGRVNWAEAFAAGVEEPATPVDATAASPWKFVVDTLQLEALQATFADQGLQPALQYGFEDINVTVNALGNRTTEPATFKAAARIAQGGMFTADGRFTVDGASAAANVKVQGFALPPLRSVLARHAALDLKQGTASAELALQYGTSAEQKAAGLRANGKAQIDDLRIDEELTGKRFIAWRSLGADAITFDASGDRPHLTVKAMRLVAPRARVEIFEDRSVNLGKVFEKKSPGANEEPSPESSSAKPEPASTPPQRAQDEEMPVQVDVARVRVDNGVVFYADRSLVLPFSAEIREFRGTASGISSKRASRTRLAFEGRVEDYGSAKVSGTLTPFAPKHFTDIRTQFRNIDMPPLSPYSATFAGRKIADGKLSLDLEYKINDGVLAGDNDILLERFTLGERVESPDALDLPLDLAVALLTDSRGRIDIAIPVSGNMNKPEFSLGGVIGEAVARMLTRIVTAPFSALGKLLGGERDRANEIAFEPGSARLTPPQQEKLVSVGKALKDRPQLKVTVGGRYDPELDGAALRAAAVRRELAAELEIEIAGDEEAAPVAVEQAATQRALEALLEARSGNDAVDQFVTEYEKRTGKKVERVNRLLGLIGQGSEDHAFYEALFEHLVEIHPLPKADLEALARRRAQAIEKSLVSKGGVSPERAAIGASGSAQANRDKMIETQLSLAVFEQGS